jgi:hypothetical protein
MEINMKVHPKAKNRPALTLLGINLKEYKPAHIATPVNSYLSWHFSQYSKYAIMPDAQQVMDEENVIIHNYSIIKKNRIMSFEEKWMELQITILSEINKAQKFRYFNHIRNQHLKC